MTEPVRLQRFDRYVGKCCRMTIRDYGPHEPKAGDQTWCRYSACLQTLTFDGKQWVGEDVPQSAAYGGQ